MAVPTASAPDLTEQNVTGTAKPDAAYTADILRLLDPATVVFSSEESGFLSLDIAGEHYTRVSLTRLIPQDSDERYISVNYINKEDEWIEIGVLADLAELPAEPLAVARAYLQFKYYIPVITRIKKFTDNRMGYLFLEVDTTAGEKKIAVNDWWHNFRFIGDNALAVTDADGNRYSVPDLSALDAASLKKLQLFI